MSTIWSHVATVLAGAGCTAVVGLPSDEPGLLDAAVDCPGLRAIVVRDQRAGACLAIGHALAASAPAVFAVTSGPALPNALVGLMEGASLGAPLVVITTRIPRSAIGRGGFQDTDQRLLAGSFAKWYHLVCEPTQLTWALRQAVHRALNGRPGIALVEIEHEVTQSDAAGLPEPTQTPVRRLRCLPEPGDLAAAADRLARACRPVLIAGGGARAADAGSAVNALVEVWPAAVLTTAAGRGTVREDAPYACGLVGLYLTEPMDSLLRDADLVLAVGTRLEETARMRWSKPRDSMLLQVDCDPDAFGIGMDADLALWGDAGLTLSALRYRLVTARDQRADEARTADATLHRARWRKRVASSRAQASSRWQHTEFAQSPVVATLAAVAGVFNEGTIIVQENGLHDMWSYHWPILTIRGDVKVIAPGEQTMMGFGVAAAVGTALADPTRVTVVLCGDGALGMSLTALTTIAEHRLGVVVVVFDNAGFGWPRLLRWHVGAPDMVTRPPVELPYEPFVLGLGGEVTTPETDEQLWTALRRARNRAEQKYLSVVRIRVDDDAPVPPGVAAELGEPVGRSGEAGGQR